MVYFVIYVLETLSSEVMMVNITTVNYRRVKFDFEVEKKVYKPQQHYSLLRMVRKIYKNLQKSVRGNFFYN